ncbi:MAG: FAD-dependent oxidoreductase [Streptosporangiaceae bacterium]|jgi:glycine/D-amino acid oxidase-like deaminating enzyme
MTDCLWFEGIPRPRRPPLPGDTEADVAVVGAGFTGLWTAYYLKELDPALDVLLIEADHPGAGASGRNGGWCSAYLPTGLSTLARRHGREAAIALQRAAIGAVDEIGAVVAREAIACDWSRDGTLLLARNAPQRARLAQRMSEQREFGFGEEWSDVDPLTLRTPGLLAASFTRHCAAIQPAKLATGLADAVARRGVRIAEDTRALRISPGQVRTDHGTVRAGTVVRATEAYTCSLGGLGRTVLPLFSRVIATGPIPSATWEQLGWPGRATMSDLRFDFPYLQRTADDRLVIGGCGVGYRYGSGLRPDPARERAVTEVLRRAAGELFPELAQAEVSHAWSGVLGAYRNWEPRVSYDRSTGLASAGGYVGDGVALSNLAGRTLAALITGTGDPLCWAGPPARKWEPEPFRSLAVGAMAWIADSADRHEDATGRPARLRAGIANGMLG